MEFIGVIFSGPGSTPLFGKQCTQSQRGDSARYNKGSFVFDDRSFQRQALVQESQPQLSRKSLVVSFFDSNVKNRRKARAIPGGKSAVREICMLQRPIADYGKKAAQMQPIIHRDQIA